MVHFLSKKLYLNVLRKQNLICYKNSLKIPSFLLKRKVVLSRGIYGRYLNVSKFSIGLKFGSYVSTRKFLNKPVYKKKR